MGSTIMEMSDEDNAKRIIERADDDRVNKRHRGGIDVMNSGIDVSEIYTLTGL